MCFDQDEVMMLLAWLAGTVPIDDVCRALTDPGETPLTPEELIAWGRSAIEEGRVLVSERLPQVAVTV